jgi:hypothetical protein
LHILRFWIPGDKRVHVLPPKALPIGGTPTDLKVSPDGKWLAVGRKSDRVIIFGISNNPLMWDPNDIFLTSPVLLNIPPGLSFNSTKIEFMPVIPPNNLSELLMVSYYEEEPNGNHYLDSGIITPYCMPGASIKNCLDVGAWNWEIPFAWFNCHDISYSNYSAFFAVVGSGSNTVSNKVFRTDTNSATIAYDFYDIYSNGKKGNVVKFSPGGDIIFTGGTNNEVIGLRLYFGQFQW